MNRIIAWSVLSLASLGLGAAGCGNKATCVEGASTACACPGGGNGAQVCTGGAYGACACSGTTAAPTPAAPTPTTTVEKVYVPTPAAPTPPPPPPPSGDHDRDVREARERLDKLTRDATELGDKVAAAQQAVNAAANNHDREEAKHNLEELNKQAADIRARLDEEKRNLEHLEHH